MVEGSSLAELLANKKVIVTVGAGGVGKTTTAAALGVAAARMGRRVLVLTIDPAKRLADSLGLQRMTTEAVTVDKSRFESAGIELSGSLTAMMLDTKQTFDELVMRYSSSPAKARKLLDNRLYQFMSTSLAGTQEYMAMEKLVAVKNDPAYDLVLLDTPPTANAIDFLDAPERLVEAIDSAAMRWFVQAFETSGKFSLNLLAKSAAFVLQGLGTITGAGFLASLAELIAELNELFGGFKQRARAVEAALRSDEVAFVLVTSPSPMSIQEVLFFSDRLEEMRMPRGAFVINRFRMPPAFAEEPPSVDTLASHVARLGLPLEDDGPARLLNAHSDAGALSALDAHHVGSLSNWAGRGVHVVRVPELPTDVHDLALLGKLASILVADGASPAQT